MTTLSDVQNIFFDHLSALEIIFLCFCGKDKHRFRNNFVKVLIQAF